MLELPESVIPEIGSCVYDEQGWDTFPCHVLEVFEDGTILVEESGPKETFLQALIEYMERDQKFLGSARIRKLSNWVIFNHDWSERYCISSQRVKQELLRKND